MINSNFIYLGVLLQLATGIGYVIDTIRGKVKPNRVSWLLWAIAALIAFTAEVKQGVGIQSLLTFTVGAVPLIVFIASFINKKSYWRIGKIDIICGLLSALGLILWITTKTGNVAIIFCVLADMLACIPTIVKVYKEPETETALVYWAGVILGVITLLTIQVWTVAQLAYPLYLTVIDVIIAMLITTKMGKAKT